MSEDANLSLELQYAHSYHNLLDKVLNKRLTEALPNFNFNDDNNSNFINTTVKNDLLAYAIYVIGYPELEVEYMLIEDILQRGQEAIEELDAWLKIWNTKFIERTKVVTSKDFSEMSTILSKFADRTRMINIEPKLMAEFENVAIETLERCKEYACTKIMAKDIVLYALRQEHKNISNNMDVVDQLRLMCAVIRRVKSISSMTGPLVYVKVK